MNTKRIFAVLGTGLMLTLIAAGAAAETAKIVTGGGKLNMRKKMDAKSVVVEKIPNGAQVEADEIGEQWTHIVYKGKSGYVLTEYVQTPSMKLGKEIYPERPFAYVRAEPDARSSSIAAVHADEPMTLLALEEDWARIHFVDGARGEVEGYMSAEDIPSLSETPCGASVSSARVHAAQSAQTLAVGETLDIQMESTESVRYRCQLYLGKKLIVESGPIARDAFSYSAREPGAYRLDILAEDGGGETVGCQLFFDVREEQADASGLFSQKDGSWLGVSYGRSNLDQSGCAIFALSHALHLLGQSGPETMPAALAGKYGYCLADGGTVVGTLLGGAGREFGFTTREDPIKKAAEIASLLEGGAMFTFPVVKGHIALACGLSADGKMVEVIDSAPSATLERMEGASLYYRDEAGELHAAAGADEIPGARYFFETNQFGALRYELELSYVAKRGVRMIKPKK